MSTGMTREERAAAVERLAKADEKVLERDLVDWTLASAESARQYHDVAEQLGSLRELHQEEEWWIQVHADELRRRRAHRREEARS